MYGYCRNSWTGLVSLWIRPCFLFFTSCHSYYSNPPLRTAAAAAALAARRMASSTASAAANRWPSGSMCCSPSCAPALPWVWRGSACRSAGARLMRLHRCPPSPTTSERTWIKSVSLTPLAGWATVAIFACMQSGALIYLHEHSEGMHVFATFIARCVENHLRDLLHALSARWTLTLECVANFRQMPP